MIQQLILATVLVAGTITVHISMIWVAEFVLSRFGPWFAECRNGRSRLAVGLVGMTLWLMASHGLCCWLWALAFWWVGALETFELSLYFSIISFTTLGYGDIILTEDWRILGGICAAAGLLVFGVSSAVIVEFLLRVRRAQRNGAD